ncbi:MAG: AAA family ATPase [bacterium]|nr:AAA family ATPase [bacterium]
MAYFVAFYSYKGGVGRTLALANLAYSLASRGKRVVVVDMDLEAPALDGFPEFALRGKVPKKGFLDYAASFTRRGRCPAISRYVHPCRQSPGSGKLWLMPSGQLGPGYQPTLGRLNWRRLHPRKGTLPLVDGLREALTANFQPHYVLIDARTGLSDIGGLSTHLLADMVVLVFNLTRSCIEGSVRAYRSFTAEGSRVRTVQLVASPVPPLASDGVSLVERRLRQARELMPAGVAYGREILRIDYDPAMVLAEELAVRRPEVFRAAASYEALREAIQRANEAEVFPVVEEARKMRSEGSLDKGLKLLEEFVGKHPDNAEGHLELGNYLLETGRPEEASKAFRRASELATALANAFERWGLALLRLADFAEGSDRKNLFEQSCRRFEEAVRHQPGDHEALNNWGYALAELAELADGAEHQALLEQACRRFEQALKYKPDFHVALDSWSFVLLKMGTESTGDERKAFWTQAAERASQASRLVPHAGDYNLACALSRLEEYDEASSLVADELIRQPDRRPHALDDPDLRPLWDARPELHQAIRESVDAGSDLDPIRRWKDRHDRRES